ncbi:hypothetical protein [Tahibacter amnicola]|uniref:Uncharacterized protein n=1 Tax=Tahibacter amnicola TaxID=2976241 RepID=A0ABY6BJP3_9GAMM|nr:hypothetical protein [Tahibacter amnicola]UXI70109.1 hypothetical protein N4264_10910 [Tahibacter amnicola]
MNHRYRRLGVLLLVLLGTASPLTGAVAAPPYSGTIWIAPNLITSADPTEFTTLAYQGQGMRLMFDRRVNAFVEYNAYLFNASFVGGSTVEVQVNPEFGSAAAAQAEAEIYLPVIGRLPRALRRDVQTVWLHRGDQPFGGGNNNLLIHNGSVAQGYIRDGVLEETLAHEASHTSLDADFAAAPGWIAAQTADPEFISTYARDNPTREDIAESFVPWLASRCGNGRVPPAVISTVDATIPHRLHYFDARNRDLRPLSGCDPIFVSDLEAP